MTYYIAKNDVSGKILYIIGIELNHKSKFWTNRYRELMMEKQRDIIHCKNNYNYYIIPNSCIKKLFGSDNWTGVKFNSEFAKQAKTNDIF